MLEVTLLEFKSYVSFCHGSNPRLSGGGSHLIKKVPHESKNREWPTKKEGVSAPSQAFAAPDFFGRTSFCFFCEIYGIVKIY